MDFAIILNALSDEELFNLTKKLNAKDIKSLTREQMIEMLVEHESKQLSNGERFYKDLEEKM